MKQNKYPLYLNAFVKTLQSYLDDPAQDHASYAKQAIVYGVKMINSEPKATTYDELSSQFKMASSIVGTMSLLTPAEFMNVFPIDKDFKGHKREMKDYFYTRDYIETLGKDKPIGEEIMYFLWEYTNLEVTFFNLKIIGYLNDLNRYHGKPSISENWADEMGLKTYTVHKDGKGQEYLFDKTNGKTQKISKPRPKHLKVVK